MGWGGGSGHFLRENGWSYFEDQSIILALNVFKPRWDKLECLYMGVETPGICIAVICIGSKIQNKEQSYG